MKYDKALYNNQLVVSNLLLAASDANAGAPMEKVICSIQTAMTHLGIDDLNAFEGSKKPAARAWAWKRPNNDAP